MARPKGSKNNAKGEGAKRDLTGKKAGKQTAAEIKQAVEAMSYSDRLVKLKEHGDAIDALEADRRDINVEIKERREKLAAIGFTQKGMDWARKRLAEDPEIRDANIFSAKATFQAYGLNKSDEVDPRQGDIFADEPAAGEKKPGNGSFLAKNARINGEDAAAKGKNRAENPHAPDTAEHDAWNEGWDAKQKQMVSELDGRHAPGKADRALDTAAANGAA